MGLKDEAVSPDQHSLWILALQRVLAVANATGVRTGSTPVGDNRKFFPKS